MKIKNMFRKNRVGKILILLVVLINSLILILTNDSQNDEIVGVSFGFTMMGIVAFFVVDRFVQKRNVRKLKEASLQAEVNALKNQINPHFFFNTLNNLYGLTVEKSEQAPEVILKLSEMMRYTIYEGEKERVAIKDEISYLQNYIELCKIRFHRDIDVKFDYLLEDENQQIPPLLFIILLENAFKHGAESLTAGGFIHIKLFATAETVHFVIRNNFAADEKSEGGIGLKNLKRRLDLLYPEKYALTTQVENDSVYKAALKLDLV